MRWRFSGSAAVTRRGHGQLLMGERNHFVPNYFFKGLFRAYSDAQVILEGESGAGPCLLTQPRGKRGRVKVKSRNPQAFN